ncbi:MAG TPA: molybdopterin-guanine dinucleotide biosynthesis protein B [Bacillota bacterium]|nr:molybdopterin-guanine dinucleotide biosynthesis protein B [Bacillota bacterium]
MDIIQIVGYKNSGKTTLANEFISYLRNKGFLVGSLKHHGHGGTPAGIYNKDSESHRRNGAVVSGVKGEGMLQITKEKDWQLEQMIDLFQSFRLDILIIEGFKKAHYPKIVMIRNTEDLSLVEQLTNIQAIVSRVPIKGRSWGFPVFSAEQLAFVVKWYMKEMKKT